MQDFGGKLAVITGGGTGMGRALARALTAQGCDVAMCDVSEENLEESLKVCRAEAPQGIRADGFVCDVADEARMMSWADHISQTFDTEHINLLFNNAGIAGGGSFVRDDRTAWEKTFDVCWRGVYNGCRAFMPMLLASKEGHVINTSSVNGFWASIGRQSAHTSYSAAKFAVKGFTEALVNDFRLNAPHLKVSLVMPGHIGTSIVINSRAEMQKLGSADQDLDRAREILAMMGMEEESKSASDDDIRLLMQAQAESFRDEAPMSADDAAKVILDGVKTERWRILVGEDAHILDEMVRRDPDSAYTEEFMTELAQRTEWQLGS